MTVKISDLPAAGSAAGTDQLEANQSGTSRRLTVAQVAAHVRSTATDTVVVAAGSASAPSIAPTGDSNTGMWSPAADTLAFATGGTERLRINSSGQSEFVAGSASAPAMTSTGDTNTGIYFPGADRIGFAEGGVQVGEFDASGHFLFNGGYGSVARAFGCRAWVNFDGTGTVAIRASGNVSSISDNGTGDYTVNFTTAMSDANYSISVVHSAGSGGTVGTNININGSGGSVAPTTSAFRMVTVGGGSVVDPLYVNASVIR